MSIGVEASDVGDLAASAGQVADLLADLDDVNRLAADDVLGYVNPPVLTGRLRDSGEVQADALGWVIRYGGTAAPYAPYVHAHDSFLTTAIDERIDAVESLYVDHVLDAVEHLK